MLRFCGPKYSLCCTLLSAWGVIQLILMGIFFKIKSPALIEDLYIPEHAHSNVTEFLDAMDASYKQIGLNCFVAAVMYVVTFFVSGWQFWVNMKSQG